LAGTDIRINDVQRAIVCPSGLTPRQHDRAADALFVHQLIRKSICPKRIAIELNLVEPAISRYQNTTDKGSFSSASGVELYCAFKFRLCNAADSELGVPA
jgi:hypothetical protein